MATFYPLVSSEASFTLQVLPSPSVLMILYFPILPCIFFNFISQLINVKKMDGKNI